MDFDVFISHASEDKADFAEPLAKELIRLGLCVWFDKFTLKVGDSLHDSIEMGLSRSRYGVVIFSKHFLSKRWPRTELNGLFSREMEGQKVILPVWHNISASEIREALPMQVDKVALLSSDGIGPVARAIIEVVRPELLETEAQKGRAFDSSSSFIEVAKSKHPGYAFSVHSGNAGAPGPETIASLKEGQHRIDISIGDYSLIESKPSITIAFSKDGAKKINDLHRTGKTQTWKAGEFTRIDSTFPLFPSGEISPFQTLTAGSNLDHLSPRNVRIEVGITNPIVFPILEMRAIRGGTEEVEIVVRHKSTPLEITFIFSIDGSQRVRTSFSWNFVGNRCSACEKVVDAVDERSKGGVLRLYDLEVDRLAFETDTLPDRLQTDHFPSEVRRVLFIASLIEKRFKKTLIFTDEMTEQDAEALRHLECLLHGNQFGTNLSVPVILTKEDEEVPAAHSSLLSGQPVTLFLEPTNYPGFFLLFGTQIVTPPWGIYAEQCVVEDAEAARVRYEQARIGEKVQLTLLAQTPALLRWKQVETPVADLPAPPPTHPQ